MKSNNGTLPEKIAIVLVLLMMLLQGFYAFFAFIDPSAFSVIRGTELLDVGDSDWVRIYASRTLFVSLIIGYLLLLRDFVLLKWIALLALVMPITDGLLAYQSHAAFTVVAKHVATVVYLMCTFLVLHIATKKKS